MLAEVNNVIHLITLISTPREVLLQLTHFLLVLFVEVAQCVQCICYFIVALLCVLLILCKT